MTYRPSDLPSRDCCSSPESRLNQHNKQEGMAEGCPVIEEFGTVCGETCNLSVFHEFRQIYDNCFKKLEKCYTDPYVLRKLAPFKKLIEDLWEQNTMLVETVEELEEEATSRVTILQDKLNKSCQKELHCTLKTKEREIEFLKRELEKKEESLKNYCCEIDNLKKDIKTKCKRNRDFLKQLKSASKNETNAACEGTEDDLDDAEYEKILAVFLKSIEDQRNATINRFHSAECQLKAMVSERNLHMKERSEMLNQLKATKAENEKLAKEAASIQFSLAEKEEILKNMEKLKSEKKELMDKIVDLQDSLKELNNNFKETRWALTTEVAEKHDQVQELRKCVGTLEEQLRQADMQTHFKDDIIKELRKELKSCKKPERRGLYDVVNEVRGKKNMKNDCISTVTFKCDSIKSDMNTTASSGLKYPDIGYSSAGSSADGKSENSRFQTQLECLQKNLNFRIQQLREQEEFTRELEEELARTKMDLTALQEKCDRQDRHCKSNVNSSISEPGFHWHYTALSCAINRIEETLKNLSSKHKCGFSSCSTIIQQEIETIRSVKNDLKSIELSKSNISKCADDYSSRKSYKLQSSGVNPYNYEYQHEPCNLIHISDVESFREKAVVGVAALEQMKDQIETLENLIRKYIKQFPCSCDETEVKVCEEKLEKLHCEFDEISEQLCNYLQKLNSSIGENSYDNFVNFPDTVKFKTDCNTHDAVSCGLPASDDDMEKLRIECQKLQKEIYDQENAASNLKNISRQLDCELQQKRNQVNQYNREIEERVGEIVNLREMVRRLGQQLKQLQCQEISLRDQNMNCMTSGSLASLFEDLQEFWCILDKSKETLIDLPRKLKEDNEELIEKLKCLEKCIYNKDETVRVLQDTVKLRECQLEEFKSKIQCSENHSSKLAQDVEEKCRLIANLQEAVRKCKKFEEEVKSVQVESLEFEVCELGGRLKKSEKEIQEKDKTMETLHDEITNLASKNFIFCQEMKLMESRLKSVYKTCHLFEKMVCDLQLQLERRDCEIESLYEKVKELEMELDDEFKKCEERASEDARCIQELTISLKNYQDDLCCAQESYDTSLAEIERRILKERERNENREAELNKIICQLKCELSDLRHKDAENQSSPKIKELECIIRQFEGCKKIYDKKIAELQKIIECSMLEHEEERKNILQKLCEEKRENLKNKTIITKLNENMKRKMINERTLREYIQHYSEDNENLKTENHELRTEIEARKKIMCSIERDDGTNLSDIEELICHLKLQKSELKARCTNLKAEVDKEIKLKKLLECRVEDLNSMLESKLLEFNQMIENYKSTTSSIQQNLTVMKDLEENLGSAEGEMRRTLRENEEINESDCLKRLLDIKSAENAKLIGQLQILKVEMESRQIENKVIQTNQDALISRLRHEVNCLENDLQDLQSKCQRLSDENNTLQGELGNLTDKSACLQNEFREKQKEFCNKLRATIGEKNDLLNSIDELQKQLEQICLENVTKEKLNRELIEECSRLKINSNGNTFKNKTEKVICNLGKEIKNLHCELSQMKENYNALNDEYHNLLEQYKCSEKKRCNLEKLYVEVCNENKQLLDLRMQYEKELCELKTQSNFLKDKMGNIEISKNFEEKKKLLDKIKDLSLKVKTFEKKVIPSLEHDIVEKNCCIENLKLELREANINSQRMRTETLRVVQCTNKYLATQRCANEILKSRIDTSNNKALLLGAENRDMEEQLKTVTRMNEFLLCQLESNKSEVADVEPRSFSPLPWGCSIVERDTTSSSEYLAESGFQSMQPSPTNMDYISDSRRTSPLCQSLKKNKYSGSAENSPCRSGIR